MEGGPTSTRTGTITKESGRATSLTEKVLPSCFLGPVQVGFGEGRLSSVVGWAGVLSTNGKLMAVTHLRGQIQNSKSVTPKEAQAVLAPLSPGRAVKAASRFKGSDPPLGHPLNKPIEASDQQTGPVLLEDQGMHL